MLDGFKKAAEEKVQGGGEELDRILGLPITQLRRELKASYLDKKFTAEQFDDFIVRLGNVGDLGKQVEIAKQAAAKHEVASELDIELNTPAKTLLWAAVLTRMMDKMEEPVATSRLWKQMKETIGFHNESIILSKVIDASLQNDDVTFDFGQPGSWFYHDPIANHVNMDMYFMLLVGFEHIRSVGLHEIGHSELSVTFTGKMHELFEKVKNFIDPRTVDDPAKFENKQFTEEEQKEIAMDVKEWELRRKLWHPAEDNCVNQFAANMQDIVKIKQDFGDSLNHISVVLQNIWALDPTRLPPQLTTEMPKPEPGEDPMPYLEAKAAREAQIEAIEQRIAFFHSPLSKSDIEDVQKGKISLIVAEKMMSQISSLTLLAFYERNGLFKGSKETWERFRNFPNDINATVDVSGIPAAKGKTAFEYLYDLSAGKNGIHALQPKPSDRFFGKDYYRKKVQQTSEARGAVVDHIWDVYVEKFADVIRRDFAKQVEEELKNQRNNDQSSGQGEGSPQNQKGNGSSKGGNSQGEGQNGGDSADPNGQPSGQTPGKSKQNEGNDDKSGDPEGGGDGKDKKKDLSKSLKKAMGDMNETPGEERAKEQGEGPGGKDKKNKKSDEKNPGEGKDGKDGKDAKKDDKKKGGWGQDPSQQSTPQRVGDAKKQRPVNENLTDEQKKALRDAADKMSSSGKDGLSSNSAGAGGMDGIDLETLAKGDWNDFQARVNELMPIISRLADTYRQIKEEQRQEIIRLSPEHELLPEDGDFRGRLDRNKYLDMKFRQAAGQPISVEDLKKFTVDRVTTMESTIEIASMIDGSGSMGGWRINAAIQSSVINYMAARMADIDSYIVVWGNKKPLIIATPESDFKKVGAMLEELRQHANGGTDLAPGLDDMIDTMSKHQGDITTISGSSHIIIWSDGDIFDATEAKKRLEAISTSGRNITVDVAILRENADPDTPSGTSMENTFQEIIDGKGGRHLGIVRGTDPQEVPMELARNILKRVRSFPVQTEPDSEKRRQLRQLYKRMTGPKF